MKLKLMATAVLVFVLPVCTTAASISFSTFVSGADLNTVEGQTNTIGFTYAGNKFVGSVYFGANNAQLYSTNLTGGSVQKFGDPIPGASGEVVLGASLGQGGFAKGDIFAASEAGGQIFHVANSGGTPTLFATVPVGVIRGILFDPGSSFGGDMLVTTNVGRIYKVDSAGNVSLVSDLGIDTEGMDIATSAWGSFAGDLLVGSEGPGTLRLISPTGTVTVVGSVPLAETVSFVPLNLGVSGNPLEGFYVANYPVNVQFAGASQFSGLQGDAIITSEDGSNARVWDVHYDAGSGGFTINQFTGNLPNQSEDGIFVTAQRIIDVSTPEPATPLLILGGGLVLMVLSRRKA